MNSNARTVLYWLGLTAVVLFACAGIPALGNDGSSTEETPYGPQISLTEHQTHVFESMLTYLEENYIYYETGPADWGTLRENYLNEINKGLTDFEFNDLMTQFEGEFAEGEVLYVTREERIETDTAASTTNYGGIGAFVNFEAEEIPHVVILDVIPGSPAEKAGLKAHDSVYAVDGDPVLLEEGGDVVLRIRGEAGTKVMLTVQTPGNDQREVEITRAEINGITGLFVDELPNTDIGYILMPTIGSTTLTDEFVAALDELTQNSEFKGVIIDLRISSNNSNFPLEEMLTLFLDGTKIDIFNRTESETFQVEGQDLSGSQDMPIVVLVGEHTSGPAEIFAAAVQETGRGIVIGSNTVGSIEAFSGFPLPNGAQVFIASTSYRIGGSEELGISGLSPEVRVEARWDEIDPAQDPVIQQAIDSLAAQAEVQE